MLRESFRSRPDSNQYLRSSTETGRKGGALRQAAALEEENPDLIIAVGGCMSQQKEVSADLARRFGFVDIIFGTHVLPYFPRLLEQARERRRPLIDISENGKRPPAYLSAVPAGSRLGCR